MCDLCVVKVVEEQEACERTITKLIQAKETLQAPLCLVEVRHTCISDDARIALHREQQQLMHNKERYGHHSVQCTWYSSKNPTLISVTILVVRNSNLITWLAKYTYRLRMPARSKWDEMRLLWL